MSHTSFGPIKQYLVVLADQDLPTPTYLGEIDSGIRQGVRNKKYAVRFTKRGADRVAAQYPSATIEPIVAGSTFWPSRSK
jgi:hypothetical protein